jgi:hypothetical protein
MPVTIVATAGAANANSYITLAEFESYLESCLHVSAVVTAATTDTKNRALVTATRLLDQLIEWDGEPTTPGTQALQWPRTDLEDDKGEDLDSETIPQRLKDAACELARYLIVTDATAELSTAGMTSLGVGSVSIEFSEHSGPKRKPIPDSVWEMISLWGKKSYGASVVGTLERA